MKDAKGVFLMLGAVIVFLLVAGLVTKTNNGETTIFTPYIHFPSFGVNKPTPTPVSETSDLKKMTIGKNSIDIVVANTDTLRSKGLGGVTLLPENQGMLFVFTSKNIVPSFWMKDMLIPLDFIWIKNNKVSEITINVPAPQNGTPDNQLQIYKPTNPIDYVLEVNAGFVGRHNILVGDNVNLNL